MIRKILYTIVPTALIASAFIAYDQQQNGTESQNLADELDRYMALSVENMEFSGSVLVARNGEILLKKGYGFANYDDLIPNTSQTVFRLASVSKQFGAAAILQLQEEGLVELHEPITTYLQNYPKDKGDKITIFHLLTHTSGIPSLTEFPNLAKDQRQEVAVDEVIATFYDLPLQFEPGTKFSYSDSGYIVIGKIIESVSGLSYGEYLENHIFKPLEMHATGYFHNSDIIPHRAVGYTINNSGQRIVAPYIDLTFPHVAGALSSTVEDMYRWDQALYTEHILTRESIESMLSRQAEDDQDSYDYGFGFRVGPKFFPEKLDAKEFGRKVVGHFGEIEGFRLAFFRYPDDDVCIIVLSNNEKAPVAQIQKDLAAIVFDASFDMPVSTLSNYNNTFQSTFLPTHAWRWWR